MTEGAVDVKDQPLALCEWANLPLHRVVVTAAVQSSGTLQRVGAIPDKARRAAAEPDVVAFAVHDDQRKEVPCTDKTAPKPLVLSAGALDELAMVLAAEVGPAAYGPVTRLPEVLQQSSPDQAGNWPSTYDYRAESFFPLDWLDEVISQALFAAPVLTESVEPPLGVLRKYMDRGYIHVLGPTGAGKTSWALNWVRSSCMYGAMVQRLPALSGWYFARREGQGSAEHCDEYQALQSLVSLARKTYDLLPRLGSLDDPPGTPRLLLSEAEYASYKSEPARYRALLCQRFLLQLDVLAKERPPSVKQPMVFVIDGGNDLWGSNASFDVSSFPSVLPSAARLPAHTYILLLSRPGPHMLGFTDKVPILRYEMPLEQAKRSIAAFLDDAACRIQQRLGSNEVSDLLREPRLQHNIRVASEGAFGYAPMLLRQLPVFSGPPVGTGQMEQAIAQLRDWKQQQQTLPVGVLGLCPQVPQTHKDYKTPASPARNTNRRLALAITTMIGTLVPIALLMAYPWATPPLQGTVSVATIQPEYSAGATIGRWMIQGSVSIAAPVRFDNLKLILVVYADDGTEVDRVDLRRYLSIEMIGPGGQSFTVPGLPSNIARLDSCLLVPDQRIPSRYIKHTSTFKRGPSSSGGIYYLLKTADDRSVVSEDGCT